MLVKFACCTCNGTGLDNDRQTCRDCHGSGIDNHGA
ncbi:DnaJ-class molecular chaperone [Thermocatellispora tengchongensis]|uniref:DnaJ-class molecular chaperone n=1 Tax=Thermocatellispora tengchongensis TaxID=1073253 RepID=A0A840PBI7_9ACTN|nr:DnaJ-class molecular chaperone [Thermocatellispora tengchongensis]